MNNLLVAGSRALAVVELVAARRDGLSFTSLASMLKLSPASLTRLLKMLAAEDWIRQDADTGFYISGQRLLQLAVGMRGQDPLLDIVSPILQELAKKTGHSACLATGQGYHFVLVAKAERPRSYQFIDVMTPNLDWIDNSMGQFILAFRPTEMVESIYNHYFRREVSPEHLALFKEIRQRKALVHHDKLVTRVIVALEPDNGEAIDSLISLAALVPNDDELPGLLKQVSDAAATIQKKLKLANLSINKRKPSQDALKEHIA